MPRPARIERSRVLASRDGRLGSCLLGAVLLAGCVASPEPSEPFDPDDAADDPSSRDEPAPPSPPPSPSRVAVRNLSLFVNDTPFTVRGVTYAPVPVGWQNGLGWIHRPEIYADLALVRAMGANTLRLVAAPAYSEDAKRFMDTVSANGLHVILGVAGPMRLDSGNESVRNATLDEVRRVVTAWKDHPAVLMWAFGNEVNYRYGGANVSDWYTLLEEAARVAKSLDPNHPVATSNLGYETADDLVRLAPSVDVFGMNHYSFAPGHWEYYLGETLERTGGRPILITEFGVDALDSTTGVENESAQARHLLEQARAIEETNGTIGAIVYEWSDEWWKKGSPWEHDAQADWFPMSAKGALPDGALSEEWFGLVRIRANSTEREPREAYHALSSYWNTAGSGSRGAGSAP